jgi:hypothetical protein
MGRQRIYQEQSCVGAESAGGGQVINPPTSNPRLGPPVSGGVANEAKGYPSVPSSGSVVRFRRQVPSSGSVVRFRRQVPSSGSVVRFRRQVPSSGSVGTAAISSGGSPLDCTHLKSNRPNASAPIAPAAMRIANKPMVSHQNAGRRYRPGRCPGSTNPPRPLTQRRAPTYSTNATGFSPV